MKGARSAQSRPYWIRCVVAFWAVEKLTWAKDNVLIACVCSLAPGLIAAGISAAISDHKWRAVTYATLLTYGGLFALFLMWRLVATPWELDRERQRGQATTMKAVHGATATAIPITSPPSTAAAVMADPGSVVGPIRLVFKMARQWHAKMRQEANRIIRGLADATMMRTTAIAARMATKAPIRLSMRMAIVPATSLHAAATKLFQVASRDELPGQPAARPGMGYFSSPRVLQLSEQCRI